MYVCFCKLSLGAYRFKQCYKTTAIPILHHNKKKNKTLISKSEITRNQYKMRISYNHQQHWYFATTWTQIIYWNGKVSSPHVELPSYNLCPLPPWHLSVCYIRSRAVPNRRFDYLAEFGSRDVVLREIQRILWTDRNTNEAVHKEMDEYRTLNRGITWRQSRFVGMLWGGINLKN